MDANVGGLRSTGNVCVYANVGSKYFNRHLPIDEMMQVVESKKREWLNGGYN